MATRLRLFAVLCALVTAVVMVWQSSPASLTVRRGVQLRSTAAPMDDPSTTLKSPVIALTDQSPFDPCTDIPIDVIRRLGWSWVMKPTDWDNRWWFSCMVMFKTSYGVIQQSLFFSPIYSNPDVDCPAENMMRAQQLTPYYKF